MASPSCLIDLKNILPKTSWSQVILALRQDPLIWQALQNPDFRALAISKFGSHPENWTPAHLGLLSLKVDFDLQTIRSTPLAELDPELRVRAIQMYEDHSKATSPKMTLSEAGLLSLALQEHFRLTNSWENIPQTVHWQTPYTCLFGLIKQPHPLLNSLPTSLVIHTILANPLHPEEQTKTFTSVLLSATNHKRLELIRTLALQRPDIANSVARNLWSGTEPDTNQNSPNKDMLTDLLPNFEQIQKLGTALQSAISQAEVQIATGDSHLSTASLKTAWQTTRQLESLLSTQSAKVTIREGHIEESINNWKMAQEPLTPSADHIAELAFTFIQNEHSKEALPFLSYLEDSSQPAALLALAIAAYQKGNEKIAQEKALKAAENHQELNLNQKFYLAKLLFDLRQPCEAVYVVESASQSTSLPIDFILFSAKAYAATGAYPQAIQAIHLATACEPNQIEIQREFALIHEYARQWPTALEARNELINLQSDPGSEDYRALANCALNLKQFQQAENACQKALETDPNDGLAFAILGEAFSKNGKQLRAEKQLQEAIRIAPDQALPWMAMARFHQRAGNLSQATDTLRKAAQASPEAAEIHLALGKDYLQAGSPSQALTSLRKANELAQLYPPMESFHLQSQIAQPLAKTLFELGHTDEALQIIQALPPLPENQSDALHLQAQILIFTGCAEQAIPLLAKALLINPSDGAINLDYARAQLEANNDPDKAINALLALLENDPENAEAMAWLAEALKAKGDSSNALAAYRKAIATRLSEDSNWYPRLAIGLAQSALALDQPEIALATLKKPWQTSPQNLLRITKTLAIAYQAAHLNEKALRTANSVCDMAPLSVETLTWFANFACQFQAFEQAIKALNRAIELEPTRADLRLQLGSIYQGIGDYEGAHREFGAIVDLDQATPRELRSAAKNLIILNHPEKAVVCLKIAVGRCQAGPKGSVCPKLMIELIDVYTQIGMLAEALTAADEFIEKNPDQDSALIGQRAILLHRLDRSADAFSALEQALSTDPNSNSLHLAAAQLNYATGDLPRALEHANLAIKALPKGKEGGSTLPTLALAADIADAGLQAQTKKEIFTYEINPKDLGNRLDYFCLRSEIALEAGEEIEAAQALTAALKASPEHPRVKALQARLTARHGDGPGAKTTLQNALTDLGELANRETITPAGILGISEAALELHSWSAAIYLLQESTEKFPQEPRAHVRLARGLVLRAEYQRLCETLHVIRHAPGESALAEFTYQSFEQAILAAAKTIEGFENNPQQAQISYWRIRGQAVFRPSGEHARALGDMPHTPESRAALLAALRHSREKQRSKQTALEYFATASHHLAQKSGSPAILMVQIALALSKQKPKIAANAAQNALDASIRQKNPSLPIFFATQAFVAKEMGDFDTAALALDNALSQWQDEARWHLWAAETQMGSKNPNSEAVVEHLSQAIKLEPKHGAHHLKLGKAYLEISDPKAAISALEQAACLLPKLSEPWMALAHAYQSTGDIAQIFQNAERAAELDPRYVDPFILLAETALEINNPEKAIDFCQKAIAINPEHPQALILHARALSMVGQSTEALQSFDQALERTPKSISLLLEHAQLTDQAAGSHSAIKELTELSNTYPEDPRVLASLAKALINDDQSDPAIEAAQKALQMNQGALDCTQESHLLETLGRLMRRNGQLDHAIHYLSEAIQCNPESIGAYLELGRAYQDRRQYAHSLEIFQQAIALAPGNANAYYQAGQTLKAAKDYAAAEEMLQNAAKLAPNDLAIRRQLGGLVALNLVHNRKDKAEIYVE